jgi:hypothetical protein
MLFQQKMPIFSFFFQKKHKYKGGRKVYNQKRKSMAACPGSPSTATVSDTLQRTRCTDHQRCFNKKCQFFFSKEAQVQRRKKGVKSKKKVNGGLPR